MATRRKNPPAEPEGERKVTAFEKAARRHATDAMRVLREIMHDKQKETSSRVAAATKIIEYAHGKPSSGDAVNVTTVNVRLDPTDQKL
jgi:hypothetical protein